MRALAAVADVHHLLAPTGGGATAISAAEKRGTAVLVPLLECYHRQARRGREDRSGGTLFKTLCTHSCISRNESKNLEREDSHSVNALFDFATFAAPSWSRSGGA